MIKKLGDYIIGSRNITVFTDLNSGNGSFNLSEQMMIVGLDHEYWWECLNTLLHEAMELVMVDNKCRYYPTFDYANSADQYTFLMTHPQFSEVCGQVANFLAQIVPDLSKEYNKKRRREKK